jgi:hypothetical protein
MRAVRVGLAGVLLLMGACAEGAEDKSAPTTPTVPQGGDPPGTAAPTFTAERNALETGGALVAPFACPVDGIQREPRPDATVLDLLRAHAGLDSLEERFVGDPGRRMRAGAACATALHPAACEESLEGLTSNGEALFPSFYEVDYMQAGLSGAKAPGYYLAFTKGDATGKVSNEAELRALYPIVDAPAKALIYAQAAGYRVECHLAGWLREEADGYVLVTSRGHERRCSRDDVVLFVGRDGSTKERHVLPDQLDPCT